MMKLKPFLSAAVALSASLFAGILSAQQPVADSTFDFPQGSSVIAPVASVAGSDCNSCATTGHHRWFTGERLDYWKERHAHYHALNRKITQRNDAWPKPWACLDRQAYYNAWTPMLISGYEEHAVLSDNFFDPNTNELNQLGIYKLAGLMQNMPVKDRQVFVTRSSDDSVNNARLASINQTINTYYRHLGSAQVSLSNRQPTFVSGRISDAILKNRLENMVPPMIQAGTAGSVQQAVGGQQ